MAFCTKCGTTLPEGHRFCRYCGTPVAPPVSGMPASVMPEAAPLAGATKDDLALFIGPNADRYLGKFARFRREGGDSFAATWHWPAFLFSFWWMLYRKMYLWAALVLLLGCVPYTTLVMMAVFGLCGNYLYYRHAKRSVAEIRSGTGTDVEVAAKLARAGGVNNVAVVVAPLLLFAVIGILAAIAIPQFVMYRQKAYEARARHQIVEACSIGTALFAHDPGKATITPEELLAAGLTRTDDVEMLLLDGTREGFSISARNIRGKKTFFTNPQCTVSEEEEPANILEEPQHPQQSGGSDI
jgi:Tfp pilus assembly protein PilE